MQLNVSSDVKAVFKLLDACPRTVSKVTVRALNKTSTSIRAMAAREIKKDLGSGITIGEIKKGLVYTRPSFNHLSARITASAKRLSLLRIAPNAKQTSTGVSYRTQGQSKAIAHAFIATMKTGYKGVFVRKGKERLPISEKYGVSIWKVFVNPTVMTTLQTAARIRFNTMLSQELKFAFSQNFR